MPEQDADVLEILIGHMAEIREINAVLGEAFGIPPQPEFLQPFRDRLHCGPRSPVPLFFFGAQRSTMLSCLAPGGACEGSQKRRRSRHCLPYFYDGRFGIDLVAALLSRLYRDAIHRVLFGLVRQRPLMAPT